MDKVLEDGARQLYAENVFCSVLNNYKNANKEYLQKQTGIVSDYLTESQKTELRKMDIL